MKRAKYLVVVIIVLLMLAVTIGPAAAQSNSPVTARVDRTSLTTDDTLTLVVDIDSSVGGAAQPQLPPLDAFQLLGSLRGSQTSIINGAMSRSTYYQFTLKPTQTGDLLIGPVTVSDGSNVFTTQPITVQVAQGNGRPTASPQQNSPFGSLPGFGNFGNLGNLGSLGNLNSLLSQALSATAPRVPTVPVEPSPPPAELQGQDLYMEAVVDNPTPYQGQQVTYHVRLYQAVRGVGGADYQPPSFTGFWSEQLPDQGEYTVQAGGRNYGVTQLTTVLFPTVVGETVIEPAIIGLPGDFFNQGGTIKSNPVAVDVQPLPDTAPPGFQGAVGQFDIQATVDKAETTVNDTVNWRVVISGQGNIENLPDPNWNEGQAWRAFDSQAAVDQRLEDGLMVGSRTYDRVLVPTQSGQLTLPALSYSYFDPQLGQYVTAETQPLPVNVLPDGSNPANAPTLPTGGDVAAGVAPPASAFPMALQPMKEAPATWSTGSPWLTDKAGFWLLWLVPLALLAGHYGWQRRQSSLLNSASARRSKKAAGKAQDALRAARKIGGNASYQACGQILTGYLSEKLDRSLTGMTQKAVAQTLLDQGVDAELAGRVERCLMLSEMGHYAPADFYQEADGLLNETESIIADLEKAL